jgi:periplasmic divalent cation tolerance protein
MTSDHVIALSTLPSMDKAAELARTLVAERLVACVNLVPGVRSIYSWKGELCDEAEVLCVMKTRTDRVDALRARLPALHPYDVPELIVLAVGAGHAPYLAWIDASVS